MEFSFLVKKFISAFLLPVPIGLTLLFIGILYLLFSSSVKGKVFTALGFLWFLLLSTQSISNMIIKPLENSHKALLNIPEVNYILVLGSGHNTNDELSITGQLREVAINRLNEGLRLYKQLPNSKIIVSGHKGHDKNTHAQMSKRFLVELGVDEQRIITLDNTLDTKMEALKTKEFVKNENFILVTSASHMKRSMMIFKKQGLKPIAAPTYFIGFETDDYKMQISSFNLYKCKVAFHEYLGILWGKLRGFI